jgi:hypothetical protein
VTLAYLFRLVCLCLASFFFVHLALGVLVRFLGALVSAYADPSKPGRSANALFALRLTPPALALLFVAAFCIPSYLQFEPVATAESVGEACLTVAILAALTLSVSFGRGLRATVLSARVLRHCRNRGRNLLMGKDSVSVIDHSPLCLALVGVVRSRIVVSGRVLRALSPAQFSAALRHEQAHRDSWDNLKRLLMLLSPDLLPFAGGLRKLENQWALLAEYAADDRAVAGNPEHSLSLAAALVRVARLGNAPLPVGSTLVPEGQDITSRVERLLHPTPTRPVPDYSLAISGLVLGGVLTTLILNSQAAAMPVIHSLLELLMD